MLYEQLLRLMRRWKLRRLQQQQILMQQRLAGSQREADEEAGAGSAAAGKTAWASPSRQQQQESSTCSSSVVRLSASEIFIASALAKIGATVATYPMIVIKSRMQAGSKQGGVQYSGTLNAITRTLKVSRWVNGALRSLPCARKNTLLFSDLVSGRVLLLQDEGLGGFFKGLQAKMFQTALNAALMLMLKEQCAGAIKSALRSSAAAADEDRPA
jgi:adenine nucleotide transporter 17